LELAAHARDETELFEREEVFVDAALDAEAGAAGELRVGPPPRVVCDEGTQETALPLASEHPVAEHHRAPRHRVEFVRVGYYPTPMEITADRETAPRGATRRITMAQFADEGVLRSAGNGASAYQAIRASLAELPEGVAVALDFDGVRAVSVPFADETLCQLLVGRSGDSAGRPIFISEADHDVRETLAAAVERRQLAVLAVEHGRSLRLLGADSTLRHTFEAAQALGADFGASDLAAELGLTAPGANNRLRALMRAGAVARKPSILPNGGKQYDYRLISAVGPCVDLAVEMA
jgi:hypothetical protein